MLKMFFVGFAYSAKFIGTEQLERQSGRGAVGALRRSAKVYGKIETYRIVVSPWYES